MSIATVLAGDRQWHVERGHVLDVLPLLPDSSVHTIVTSPPYLGLRDYGIAPSAWGGDEACAHAWEPAGRRRARPHGESSIRRGGDGDRHQVASGPRLDAEGGPRQLGAFCSRGCGAWLGCLGLEPDADLYVAHMVTIFRELRRVLRTDGTCWLNIGDSYAAHTSAPRAPAEGHGGEGYGKHGWLDEADRARRVTSGGIAAGNLLGIPWRVALALQADGWIVRQEVIWEKPSPMPESVAGWRWARCRRQVAPCSAPNTGGIRGTALVAARGGWTKETHPETRSPATWEPCPGCSRCSATDGYVLRRGSWRATRAHEQLFMLTKSMGYFADAQAVAEPTTGGAHARGGGIHPKSAPAGSGVRQNDSFSAAVRDLVAERNPRSVWRIQSRPFSSDGLGVAVEHYATFPVELASRCIRASTSAGGVCASCGAPRARVLGDRVAAAGQPAGNAQRDLSDGGAGERSADHLGRGVPWQPTASTTIGWRPTCNCLNGGGESSRGRRARSVQRSRHHGHGSDAPAAPVRRRRDLSGICGAGAASNRGGCPAIPWRIRGRAVMPSLFPIVAFDRINDWEADRALATWGHWLGGCARPFGRHSFGLTLHGQLLAVAVSASTVAAMCGGYPRREVVELARLCSHPDRRELTRVALRLWRVVAPAAWTTDYWPVRAVVSYANAVRHRGDIYRFDGWRKVAEVHGGRSGPGSHHQPRTAYEAKSVWVYDLPVAAVRAAAVGGA